MRQYVGLLRGINVGGKNKLPMQELKNLAIQLGWQNPKTYIQSGNIVFDAATPSAGALSGLIEKNMGFKPSVLILTKVDFLSISAACPFESATGKEVHVYFLEKPATPNIDKLKALKFPSEEWALTHDAFYLFAPEGIARSKLAAGAERALGVSATARNWNTIQAIESLLGDQ